MAYRHILTSTRINNDDRSVVFRACEWAIAYAAKLSIVTVVPQAAHRERSPPRNNAHSRPNDAIEHKQRRLSGYLAECGLSRSNVKIDQLEGWLDIEVPRSANRKRCDLVVLGARARHDLDHLFGTLMTATLERTRADVLGIIGGPERRPYQRVVVALSNAPNETDVLHRVKELHLPGARIELLHVLPSLQLTQTTSLAESAANTTLFADSTAPPTTNNSAEGFPKNLALQAKKILPQTHRLSVRYGEVTAGIRDHMDATKVDLLIVGSGHRADSHRKVSSITDQLVHGAFCDTLVVRVER